MSDPLAPLRARFRARARDDLARLRALKTGDLASSDLRMLAHNMAGAAGTFGYAALGAAAMAVDDRYVVGDLPDADQLILLEHLLAQAAAEAD
ncbi:Hpt domain-containing protein [Brevundimonas sp. NIBR11]|uniref:Hpt domain-containing protein n=1 Tax=Brevundimonas sp. NIBR11 TaxID=3015999 RepID=UPI0022F0399F|nr:Hpt domain-containing protein [Brevundimonas sp. NIBR11]